MSAPIVLERLSKTYGRGDKQVFAVKDIDLEVPVGVVYGFLGPNGAGKTTTIRMLMDLIRPTSGTAYIFGKDVRQDGSVLAQLSGLVEGATFYEYMTGRDNLEVLARTSGVYSNGRIDALLEQVGLSNRAKQQVKGYSMGMKQRLGIAGTLLTDPDLVIFDEPTNGLDPAGIQEIREFIRSLAHEQGKTVFLSSHLLNEVEQVCDRVAIINEGVLMREGTVKSLLEEGKAQLRVQVSSPQEAATLLGKDWQIEVDQGWVSVLAAEDDSPRIVRRLVEADHDVHQMIIQKQSLEEYFMAVTGDRKDA